MDDIRLCWDPVSATELNSFLILKKSKKKNRNIFLFPPSFFWQIRKKGMENIKIYLLEDLFVTLIATLLLGHLVVLETSIYNCSSQFVLILQSWPVTMTPLLSFILAIKVSSIYHAVLHCKIHILHEWWKENKLCRQALFLFF